jgi:hypothetical protein
LFAAPGNPTYQQRNEHVHQGELLQGLYADYVVLHWPSVLLAITQWPT